MYRVTVRDVVGLFRAPADGLYALGCATTALECAVGNNSLLFCRDMTKAGTFIFEESKIFVE